MSPYEREPLMIAHVLACLQVPYTLVFTKLDQCEPLHRKLLVSPTTATAAAPGWQLAAPSGSRPGSSSSPAAVAPDAASHIHTFCKAVRTLADGLRQATAHGAKGKGGKAGSRGGGPGSSTALPAKAAAAPYYVPTSSVTGLGRQALLLHLAAVRAGFELPVTFR